MIETIPKIKPLIEDIKSIHIGYYLKSNDFNRYVIELGIDELWNSAFKKAKSLRTYFSLGFDHDVFDSQDALILLLNDFFQKDFNFFSELLTKVLVGFIQHSEEFVKIDNIIKDLQLINFPETQIEEIKKTSEKYVKKAIPPMNKNTKKTINWISAYNLLFDIINTEGETYYSGKNFLDLIREIDFSIPNYNQLMEKLRKEGKSTSRKDYYYDTLMNLSEENRLNVYNKFIENLKASKHDKLEKLISVIQITNDNLQVPISIIPENLWNADKLKDFIERMDKSIKESDYNLTLTLAYSCLEGFYKAFLKDKSITFGENDDLPKLSKIIKDHIIDNQKNTNVKIPEQIITLISTITSAISNARNGFSLSHFDEDANKWLSEFTRDCVNSVIRLLIKFM